jgi:uncharacterized SAM-binding protein YcdF (DUF218 family)
VLALAKAAGLFLMPPGILILAGVVALILVGRYPRTGRFLAVAVLLAAYLLSIRPVSEALLQPLEEGHPPLAEVPSGAEAIVVLGGGQVPRSPEYAAAAAADATLQRTRYAARLARGNDLPVFTTGGLPLGRGVPTGTLMARALTQDFGLSPGRVRTETTARNTREHVPYLRDLLGERSRVVLVTTAWHMPRAVATFRAGGLDPVPAPTDYHPGYGGPYHWLDLLPQAGYLDMSSNACHEYLGMAYYALRGWLG